MFLNRNLLKCLQHNGYRFSHIVNWALLIPSSKPYLKNKFIPQLKAIMALTDWAYIVHGTFLVDISCFLGMIYVITWATSTMMVCRFLYSTPWATSTMMVCRFYIAHHEPRAPWWYVGSYIAHHEPRAPWWYVGSYIAHHEPQAPWWYVGSYIAHHEPRAPWWYVGFI